MRKVKGLKLNYAPKWEIADKRVDKLDKKRVELNRLHSLIELELMPNPNVCPSLETIKKRRALIKSMETSIGRIGSSRLKGFDKLVLEDIMDNVRKARADDSYFHNNSRNITLGRLLTSLFGKSAYTRILSMARPENLDHKAIHDYYDIMHDMWNSALDSSMLLNGESFKDLRKQLFDHVKKYKKSIDELYKSLGILDQPLDYRIEVEQSDADFSHCDNCNSLLVLDPDRVPTFRAKKGGNEYTTHTATGLIIGIHEYAHGLQHAVSEECMPDGLKYDDVNFSRISHGPACEGVALFAEDIGISWMRANRENLEISENDLHLVEVSRKAYVPEKILEAVYGLLVMDYMNSKAPAHWKKEAHKKLAEISGLKVLSRDNNRFGEPDFSDTLLRLSYILGERRIKKIAGEARKERGLRNSHGEGLILQALMTGAWTNPRCQRKFVLEYFIPQARKDGYL